MSRYVHHCFELRYLRRAGLGKCEVKLLHLPMCIKELNGSLLLATGKTLAVPFSLKELWHNQKQAKGFWSALHWRLFELCGKIYEHNDIYSNFAKEPKSCSLFSNLSLFCLYLHIQSDGFSISQTANVWFIKSNALIIRANQDPKFFSALRKSWYHSAAPSIWGISTHT